MSSAGTRGKSGGRLSRRVPEARRTAGWGVPGRGSARPRRRRLRWLGRSVAACAAVVFGLIAWATLARALAPKGNTSQDHFDVLIVLGAPADADGNPSPKELARVTEAVREYERGVAPRIIMTGAAVRNGFVEARVMARTAEAQGIPKEQIYLDEDARNTIENACDSLRMMRKHGWQSAEVVTSVSQLPRAGLILSKLPLEWRGHAAPPVEPEGGLSQTASNVIEIAKTVYYLAWSRRTEPCTL